MLRQCVVSLLASLCVMSVAQAGSMYAVHNVRGDDALIMRDRPSKQGEAVESLEFNETFIENLHERDNGWCKVRFHTIEGWAFCNYLGTPDGAYPAYQLKQEPMNLRKAPSLNAPVLLEIPAYSFNIAGNGKCTDKWCPVLYQDPRTYQELRGWVARKGLYSWTMDLR